MTKFSLDRSDGATINNTKIYFRVSVALAFICAALRSLAFVFSFDSDIGYFDASFISTVAHLLIVVSCAFALSAFIFINNRNVLPRKLDLTPNLAFFASVFAGFVMVADFAYKVFTMIGEERFEYYSFIFKRGFRSENAYLLRATAVIEILGTLSALLAAVWFFIRSSKKQNPKLCVAFGFFPVLRALSGIAAIYFDMNVQMNHPSKLALQFALISIMFNILCELRFFVSEDHHRSLRYLVSGCVALVLGISVGVSEMVGFFTGRLSKGTFCVEAFFCLTIGAYILTRVAGFLKEVHSCPATEESSVCETAEAAESAESAE